MQPPPLVVKANLLRSCQPRAGGWEELRGRRELGCVLAGEGVGWAESRHAAPLFPAAGSIGEHAGAVENKKVPPARCVHVGELCAPGSWALTSDPGSSRLSLRCGSATFYPGCHARAALVSSPSPCSASIPGLAAPPPAPPAPREDSPPGNPRPAPTPAPAEKPAARPCGRGARRCGAAGAARGGRAHGPAEAWTC